MTDSRPVYWTPERTALVARHYPTRMSADDMLAAVNALPGLRIDRFLLVFRARATGLKRPKGFPIHRAYSNPEPAARREVASPRRCLSCRAEFASAGVGNRVCARCKDGEAWAATAIIEHGVRS